MPTVMPTVMPTITPSTSPSLAPSSATIGTNAPTTTPIANQQYCATFSSGQADGATGYFLMSIANGRATYTYNLDLTNLGIGSSLCSASPISSGLKYHVHSYWNNMTTTSSAGSYCGASLTGGHYDPTNACSSVSQNIGTSCVNLGRTASQGYTYTCNSTLYSSGTYSDCEVGDISGKFGVAMPISGSVFSATGMMDNTPPYISNYRNNIKNSIQWSSVIFHCGSTRLVCAEFTTNLAGCAAALQPNIPTPSPSLAPSGSLSPSNLGSTTQQYCASFSSGQTSGASGYFAMQISNGQAKYAYDIDLSSFGLATGTCPATLAAGGLNYHIHTYWNNATALSASGSKYCGASVTGGHYDPYLACNSVSQNIGTSCLQLNRTSTRGYTYTCNSTLYGAGDYSECEVGDLSYHIKRKIKNNEYFTEFEIFNWFIQICLALEYVHARRVIHRDLKS
jgi:hypothetical protein